MTVTSQATALPLCRGIRERSSGRFPSIRVKSDGSSQNGTWADAMARAMRSLKEWCLTVPVTACLHTKAWAPVASTREPQELVCGSHRFKPSRGTTAIRTASSSNCDHARRNRQDKHPLSTVYRRSCSQKPGPVTAISDWRIECIHIWAKHSTIPSAVFAGQCMDYYRQG